MGQPEIPEKLKARTVEEWVAGIKALRGHGMRCRVAAIVWWDFSKLFGDGVDNPLEHWILGYYDEASLDIPEELVMEGLRKLGYSELLLAAKFKKRTQPMSKSLADDYRESKAFKRKDCHTDRATHWNQKERSLRCEGY